MWNAKFGKIGLSPAMHIACMCPYYDTSRIEKLPPEKRSAYDRRVLKLARGYVRKWNPAMGQIVGEKIAAGDYTFFEDLAAATKNLADKGREHHSIRRYWALEHKLDCETWGAPFTLKGLRRHYAEREHKIDSSTLSKMYRWARSADWHKLPLLPTSEDERPENAILKP
jgi:hypothetical protein